ncbi:mycofactocin precursor MftA [Streptomyces albogriseolus]
MHEEQTRAELDTVDDADDLVEEVLVEEVSIDGMCGVY